jgi:hypothetical protein
MQQVAIEPGEKFRGGNGENCADAAQQPGCERRKESVSG